MQNTQTPSNPTIQNNQSGAAVTVKEVIEAINNSQNILVALSKDPNIEELTDVLALTLALDAAGKNATAIFSGTLPEKIEFLNPEKVFETDTNSLQDFIISLNKAKADHLRYKVEGEFVKIYITPYRTMLTEKDLQFTRGDFNIDLVIALDVKDPNDFDAALTQHAKIMHNARVASIVLKSDVTAARKFGDIIWQSDAGTLTEAVTQIAEQLNDKREISSEVATALLAGLVAVSDRFMNDKTSPAMMSLAARLMSVGADQRAVMTHIAGEKDSTTPAITPAQQHPAPKAALDSLIPAAPLPEPTPESTPEPTAEPTPEPELTPAPADAQPAESAENSSIDIAPLTPEALQAALAGGTAPPPPPTPDALDTPAVLPPVTDANATFNPDGDPNTLPPPSEMSIPKDDDIFNPSASIIEESINTVGYVDKLTGTPASEATATPTPPPVVAPPAPLTPTAPLPTPNGAVPTVADIQSMIKNRLPLPPEFDPKAPPAAPPTPLNPIIAFGQPTQQNIKPEIDSIVPPEVAGIHPVASRPNAAAARPNTQPIGPAKSAPTSGTISAPSVAPPPAANAFKIPAF